jgi:sporulation protein YlmC with PRC-barrel domain
VLRAVRELGKLKVAGADEGKCGRLKDVYFDDSTWAITHLVVVIEPWQTGQKQVLVKPEQVDFVSVESGVIKLALSSTEIDDLPLASSALPVCKQYASFAMASPGARMFARGLAGSDPHLRSTKAVMNYRINTATEFGGTLADLIFDEGSWSIRYLAVEQVIEQKKLRFHILPQAVERFSWAAQRVFLRELQPVRLDGGELETAAFQAA